MCLLVFIRLVKTLFFTHTALWWGRPQDIQSVCPDQHHWHASLLHPWWWYRFHSSRIRPGCLDGGGNREQHWNPAGTALFLLFLLWLWPLFLIIINIFNFMDWINLYLWKWLMTKQRFYSLWIKFRRKCFTKLLFILQTLNFSLDGKLSLSDLTMALENELLVTKNGIHQAALASFKAEIRHLLWAQVITTILFVNIWLLICGISMKLFEIQQDK